MTNPWLGIPYRDYERHMADPLVGQLALLNDITRRHLRQYKPQSLAIAGIGTGNGLEHVNPRITKKIYGIDINPEYLEVIRSRYADRLPGLQLFCLDLNSDCIPFSDAELVVAGLIYEYLDLPVAVTKTAQMLLSGGILAVVIQKSGKNSFVSPTSYKSLNALNNTHREVDDTELIRLLSENGIALKQRKNHLLNQGKILMALTFVKD